MENTRSYGFGFKKKTVLLICIQQQYREILPRFLVAWWNTPVKIEKSCDKSKHQCLLGGPAISVEQLLVRRAGGSKPTSILQCCKFGKIYIQIALTNHAFSPEFRVTPFRQFVWCAWNPKSDLLTHRCWKAPTSSLKMDLILLLFHGCFTFLHHLGCIKPSKTDGIFCKISWFAGFLNHQQYQGLWLETTSPKFNILKLKMAPNGKGKTCIYKPSLVLNSKWHGAPINGL